MYTSNIQTKPNQTAENYALYTCVCRWKTMLTTTHPAFSTIMLNIICMDY